MRHFQLISSAVAILTIATTTNACVTYNLENGITFQKPFPGAPFPDFDNLVNFDPDDRDYFNDPALFDITKIEMEICEVQTGKYTTKIEIQGTGLPLLAPVTVWQLFADRTDPIFVNGGAGGAGPLARVDAAFTNGRRLNGDPNTIEVLNPDGDFAFEIELDYNPLLADQAPLVNARTPVKQSAYCGVDAIPGWDGLCQNNYKASETLGRISSEYLRIFDPITGQQLVDENGNAVVARSPSRVGMLAVAVHMDLLTHGFEAGVHKYPQPFGNCQIPSGDDEFACNDAYVPFAIFLPNV